MGQSQILLIVLSMLLIAIASAVGITMFNSYSTTANKDSIVLEIVEIGNFAYQYRLRPTVFEGGNGKFTGVNFPAELINTPNAEYVTTISDDGAEITIEGGSKIVSNAKITVTFGLSLQIIEDYAYIGW